MNDRDPALDLPRTDPLEGEPILASGVDGNGARYVQVDLGGDHRLRVTRTNGREYFPEGKGIRIQIQDENGHLRQGPEVGLACIDQVLAAIAIAASGHR